MRKAKIVCTIGPASRSEAMLGALIDAGMDVARINFSHGTREEHRAAVEAIRRLSDSVAIMQDLRGPKMRVGRIAGDVRLAAGDTLILTTRKVSDEAGAIHVSYADLPKDVAPGDSIYLADGTIHLTVEHIDNTDVRCLVLHGGVLSSNKGLNLPGVKIGAQALTAADRRDLDFGVPLGVDYVALSFVRSAEEVSEAKRLLEARGSAALVVAKIEKQEALESLDAIVAAADAIMIARGDLGVEIAPEEVPIVQKSIIAACRRFGKPVITATQMLESMTTSERPTRAEASDVANAVLDGTDAVMLSAETAVGRYPVEAVTMMHRIAVRAESYKETGNGERRPWRTDSPTAPGHPAETMLSRPPGWGKEILLADAICAGAVEVARRTEASAIACLTHTGRTARLLASRRPPVPIVALTDNRPVVRHMSLVWGVEGIRVDRIDETETIFTVAGEKLKTAGHGGTIVLVAGIPTRKRKHSNTVHLIDV